MKSRGPILLLLFAFFAVHRLPAPIQEESPTPKPKAVAKKKTDDEGKAKSQTQTKSKESPFAQFAGVWTGSINGRALLSVGLDTDTVSTPVTLRISNDGMIQATSGGATSQQQFKGNVSSDGQALIWSSQFSGSSSGVNYTAQAQASLRLTGPRTGFYKSDMIMNMSANGKGVISQSGTLTKQ
jgi:hypothetical protein